jgi:hypothetical protein
MDVAPLPDFATPRQAAITPAMPAPREGQRSFLEALGRHGVVAAPGEGAGPEGAERGDDRARRAAEQFVSTTFLLPILKELRAQNRTPPPFGPTQAEKTLGPIMDAQLADRMVRSSQFALVDRVASELRGVERRAPEPPR